MKSKKDYTASSGNVFEDIGLPDAEDCLIKAELVSEIAAIIQERKLTQAEAARIMGIEQPRISELLRGRFSSYSIDRLIRYLNRLGTKIEVTFHRQLQSA